jgi:proliferating cell nuclear antigen
MGRIIDIRTENISDLKILFETLKDVLSETIITFTKVKKKSNNNQEYENSDLQSNEELKANEEQKSNEELKSNNNNNQDKKQEDGIKILNIDENQTLMIYVKLLAKGFLKFDCKYPEYNIGVELTPLYQQFKIMDKEGILSMYVDSDDKLNLNMDVSNVETNCNTNHQMKLMDLNTRDWKLPSAKFDAAVTMKCNEFHKICRNMVSTDCEYVEIICTDKKITFSSVSTSGKISRTYENGDNVKIKYQLDTKNLDNKDDKKKKKKKDKKKKMLILSNIFELKYLIMFSKCNNICSDIQIFLKETHPMFIRYKVATLGEMLVGLSPIDESSLSKSNKNKVKDNNNFNPVDDIYYPKSEIRMKQL